MQVKLLVVVGLVLAAGIGCGKSPEELEAKKNLDENVAKMKARTAEVNRMLAGTDVQLGKPFVAGPLRITFQSLESTIGDGLNHPDKQAIAVKVLFENASKDEIVSTYISLDATDSKENHLTGEQDGIIKLEPGESKLATFRARRTFEGLETKFTMATKEMLWNLRVPYSQLPPPAAP